MRALEQRVLASLPGRDSHGPSDGGGGTQHGPTPGSTSDQVTPES